LRNKIAHSPKSFLYSPITWTGRSKVCEISFQYYIAPSETICFYPHHILKMGPSSLCWFVRNWLMPPAAAISPWLPKTGSDGAISGIYAKRRTLNLKFIIINKCIDGRPIKTKH
jgi:hypothetical protein